MSQSEETILLTDYFGRTIRLTAERQAHILEHPELAEQHDRIAETLADPDSIIETKADSTVHIYHKLYPKTPVTRKYLLVAVKMIDDVAGNSVDAFVLTAFFSSRQKKGDIRWTSEK